MNIRQGFGARTLPMSLQVGLLYERNFKTSMLLDLVASMIVRKSHASGPIARDPTCGADIGFQV